MSEQQQELTRSMNVSYKEPLYHVQVCDLDCRYWFTYFLYWAWLFNLEEVSTGTGKVIPSSKEQVIQSLEGGILTKLNVQEGDIVQKGEILAQLDPTRFASNVGESKSFNFCSSDSSAFTCRSEWNTFGFS
jgi:adhesin transport system membrane fusion protein